MGYSPYSGIMAKRSSTRRFSDFMRELDKETRREGPAAVAESEAFRAHFQVAREFIQRREALGLTQSQLAERSGIQQSEISRIERGSANPTLRTVHVLARSLRAEFHLTPTASPRSSSRRKAALRRSPTRASG